MHLRLKRVWSYHRVKRGEYLFIGQITGGTKKDKCIRLQVIHFLLSIFVAHGVTFFHSCYSASAPLGPDANKTERRLFFKSLSKQCFGKEPW